MIKTFRAQPFPLEMHKARIVQNLTLSPIEKRLRDIEQAGNNTFLLKNRDVFLDMLTDSGVNAMSDRQQAAMFLADDSYAGSETFYRLERTLKDFFGKEFFLPAHQGRACENLLASALVQKGQIVPMNYHFTTTKAHITERCGSVLEIPTKNAFDLQSDCPFKGNMDLDLLREALAQKDRIAFVRMEAGTNLIGGQPFSLQNLMDVYALCCEHQVKLVLDASLLSDNLYFIKKREEMCRNDSIREIVRKIAEHTHLIYFSGRKLGCARGGGIVTSDKALFEALRPLIPLFEGFLTYGGMSVKEMEAMAVGIEETLNEDVICQGPIFIEFMTAELLKRGIPVITPAGGLGCHIDAGAFLPHLTPQDYPAAALASAFFIASGIRGMERGTMSEQRNEDGTEHISSMELVRLALPRRVFSMSHILFAVDRLEWLYEHRDLIGALEWTEEPTVLRSFYGKLKPRGDWQQALVQQFKADFGESL